MKRIVVSAIFSLITAALCAGLVYAYPVGAGCPFGGLQPTAVSTGAFATGSNDCAFSITGLGLPATVTFRSTYANLPWCQCTSSGGTQAAIMAVPSATATNGGGDIVTITGGSGVTSVVCTCIPH